MDKNSYLRGEEIVATVAGFTKEMEQNNAFLAIYPANAGHDAKADQTYLHVADDSQIMLSTPNQHGSYEVRFYRKSPASADALVGKAPFTVDGDVEVSLALDKATYARGEEIVATLGGVTERMQKDSAFVGLYRVGGGSYGNHNVHTDDSNIEFSTPPETGAYELRLYRKSRESDDTLAASVPFTVDGEVKVTLALDKKIYTRDDEIVAKLTGITRRMKKDGAFLAIYEAQAEHGDNAIAVFQPVAGDSEAEIDAPHRSGSYEIRLYRKDFPKNDATLAATVPFTVKHTPRRR
ncbi:MAG: hypothetical protein LBF50_05080 [Azoarcus sp.]|nr:hypothetical protein [Azoarcus sp.]